jgi:hypothetical protein
VPHCSLERMWFGFLFWIFLNFNAKSKLYTYTANLWQMAQQSHKQDLTIPAGLQVCVAGHCGYKYCRCIWYSCQWVKFGMARNQYYL